ncbi:MAG: hypothetical protein JNK05_27935 [Myxococcales bacterium]|nr:hypothetical protein [Myxococcales bacterium]
MSESTAEPKVVAPYRPSNKAGEWALPLRSDPPWLSLGLVASTAASLGGFAALFRWFDPRVHVALSLLPGLTAATFLSSAVAFVGRRWGGSLELYAKNRVLRVRGRAGEDVPWLDARDNTTFGAHVLEDPKSAARVFVFTQGEEPTVVIDRSGAKLSEAWERRVIRVDFANLAVSAESAGAVEIAVGASSAPMLETLEETVGDALLIRQPLPSGEVLLVDDKSLVLGDRRIYFGKDVTARRIAIATPAGEVLGLSITHDLTSILFACVDPTAHGATADVDAPDAYLHPALFAALSAKLSAVDTPMKR